MHEYYRNNILKLKKENEGYLRFVKVELEQTPANLTARYGRKSGASMKRICWSISLTSAVTKSAGQRTSLALTFLWRWVRYLNATVFLWRVRHV